MSRQIFTRHLQLCLVITFYVLVNGFAFVGAQECSFIQNNLFLGDRPDILLTGDLDSDGDLDIVASELGSQEEVHILLNDGQGTFPYRTRTCFGPIVDVSDVEMADLDGDGHLDFAVATEFNNFNFVEVSFWLNDGNAGFSRQGEILLQSGSVDFSPNITIADFDNNSIVDIALTGESTGNSDIYVFFGNRNGVSFDEPPEELRIFTSAQIYSVDVNNDSVPDILATTETQSRLHVFLSNGDRTFQDFEQFFIWDRIEAFVDLNGDSNIDLLCSSIFSTGLGIATGDGHGEFNFFFGSGIQSARKAATVLEVDGDGRLDVASSSILGRYSISWGFANEFFPQTQEFEEINVSDDSIASGDFDSDGKTDLVVSRSSGVAVLMNDCTREILLGDADGNGTINILDVSSFVFLLLDDVYLLEADIDQNGIVDLLDVAPFVEILSN